MCHCLRMKAPYFWLHLSSSFLIQSDVMCFYDVKHGLSQGSKSFSLLKSSSSTANSHRQLQPPLANSTASHPHFNASTAIHPAIKTGDLEVTLDLPLQFPVAMQLIFICYWVRF